MWEGNLGDGITVFELALEKGTNDPDIRTAVYSQLGNAYFYLKQYTIAKGTDFYLLLIRPGASLIVDCWFCLSTFRPCRKTENPAMVIFNLPQFRDLNPFPTFRFRLPPERIGTRSQNERRQMRGERAG